MEKKKGFTLVEVLIVIVILAILASLVLPKMVAQPERALVAEAVNYLGVIRRAQEALVGTNESDWIEINSRTAPNDANWQSLGLGPLPARSAFDYRCKGGDFDVTNATAPDQIGICTATRRSGPKRGGQISINLANGRVTDCSGLYLPSGPYNVTGTTCV